MLYNEYSCLYCYNLEFFLWSIWFCFMFEYLHCSTCSSHFYYFIYFVCSEIFMLEENCGCYYSLYPCIKYILAFDTCFVFAVTWSLANSTFCSGFIDFCSRLIYQWKKDFFRIFTRIFHLLINLCLLLFIVFYVRYLILNKNCICSSKKLF